MLLLAHTVPAMLPNLDPCAPMPNKNIETDNWKINREAFYFLCQAKGRHRRLAPQELCHHFLGNYRDSYRGVCSRK